MLIVSEVLLMATISQVPVVEGVNDMNEIGVSHHDLVLVEVRDALLALSFSLVYNLVEFDTLWASVDFHLVLRVSMCYNPSAFLRRFISSLGDSRNKGAAS
jgi:hypothetical protein